MENILGTLITVASTLGAVWLTQSHEKEKWKLEDRRWYTDYFLGRKIDALSALYAALVDCYYTLDFYSACPPTTMQEFRDKVSAKVDIFLRANATASIYLNDEAQSLLIDVCGAFKHGRMAFFLKLPDSVCPVDKKHYDDRAQDWSDGDRLQPKYEKAVAWFKNNLNPRVLEGLRVIE